MYLSVSDEPVNTNGTYIGMHEARDVGGDGTSYQLLMVPLKSELHSQTFKQLGFECYTVQSNVQQWMCYIVHVGMCCIVHICTMYIVHVHCTLYMCSGFYDLLIFRLRCSDFWFSDHKIYIFCEIWKAFNVLIEKTLVLCFISLEWLLKSAIFFIWQALFLVSCFLFPIQQFTTITATTAL
jgi:hypothetical protein